MPARDEIPASQVAAQHFFAPVLLKNFTRTREASRSVFPRLCSGRFFCAPHFLHGRWAAVFVVALAPQTHHSLPCFKVTTPAALHTPIFLPTAAQQFISGRYAPFFSSNCCAAVFFVTLRTPETPQFVPLRLRFFPGRPHFFPDHCVSVFFPRAKCSVLPGYLTPALKF